MSGWTRSNARSGLLLSLIGVALICAAGLAAGRIATQTVFRSHPDEAAHVDAFCYFQGRWWPPDLNTGGLLYSGYGWSRVYTGEVVYIVYGNAYAGATAKLAGLRQRLRPQQAQEPAQLTGQAAATGHVFLPMVSVYRLVDLTCRQVNFRHFRYMNVALYVLTLAVALAAGRRSFWTIALFVALVAVPQIPYIYSYANSDAWGLSFSVFLLLYALHLSRRPGLTPLGVAGLGVLTGMVLLTKKPYWLTIPFAYLFLGEMAYRQVRMAGAGGRRRIAALLLLLLVTIAVVAGPLVALYPWTQGDFAAGELAMREMRAIDGFKPSNPTAEGVRLASRGEPFRVVWADPAWWGSSGKSAYGLFGVMAIRLPDWMYFAAGAVALLGIGLTLYALADNWRRIPLWTKAILGAAPVLVALNLLASLYNSWVIDHQAQGRYLLSALLPLTFLWAGLYEYESARMQRVRWILLAIFCAVGLFALWTEAVSSPRFTAP